MTFHNTKKQETKYSQPISITPKKSKNALSHRTEKMLFRTGILLSIVVGLSFAFAAFYFVSAFYDDHGVRFQPPVIFQAPVVVYNRQGVVEAEVQKKVKQLLPTQSPAVTTSPLPKYINFNLIPKVYADFEAKPSNENEAEIINSQKHAAVIWRIYELESTFGRKDNCREKGLVNGFGFAVNTSGTRCYTSFAEVVKDVNNWIDDKYSNGWDISTMVCYYNRGVKSTDCPYAKNFLSIQ